MRLKQYFNPDLRKAVREYHLAQRDTKVQLVRWVCDPEGYSFLLVRFTDEQGKKVSSLMSCDEPIDPESHEWIVGEPMNCPREDEGYMVQGYMADSMFYPEGVPDEPDDEHKYIGD